ncbi:MAG: hypothetical protein CML60_10335 [Rhodobacteraceae bacterium]|nr:hypothetical protein [Paracoccaceae bacterium]
MLLLQEVQVLHQLKVRLRLLDLLMIQILLIMYLRHYTMQNILLKPIQMEVEDKKELQCRLMHQV